MLETVMPEYTETVMLDCDRLPCHAVSNTEAARSCSSLGIAVLQPHPHPPLDVQTRNNLWLQGFLIYINNSARADEVVEHLTICCSFRIKAVHGFMQPCTTMINFEVIYHCLCLWDVTSTVRNH